MNRTRIARLASLVSVVLGQSAAIACGPRLKPVEYEEPKTSSASDSDDVDSSSSSKPSAASGKSDDKSTGAPVAKGGACKDKKCGAHCSECPAGDDTCMEVLVLKECNSKGQCVPAPVECTAPEKSDKSDKSDKSGK